MSLLQGAVNTTKNDDRGVTIVVDSYCRRG